MLKKRKIAIIGLGHVGTHCAYALALSGLVDELVFVDKKEAKLRSEVVTDPGEAPNPPAEPSGDDPAAATEEYASYIFSFAGDEWNGERGIWASEDGPYATALADYEVTADGASYEAAQAAYYVAYQEYTTKQTEVSQKWSDYVNELLGNSSIQIYTLKS